MLQKDCNSMFSNGLQYGLNVDGNVDKSLTLFLEHMLNGCKKLNLVSRRDVNRTLTELIRDSLQVLNWSDCKLRSPVLDIGTGGGFPGMPLKLVKQAIDLYLLDSNRRKCTFLEVTRHKFQLENVHVINQRVEDVILSGEYQHFFASIISRATATTDVLLNWARELLQPGGELILWKGSAFEDELDDADLKGWSTVEQFDFGKEIKLVKFILLPE